MLSDEEKKLLKNVLYARAMGGVLSLIDVAPFWVEFNDNNEILVNLGDQVIIRFSESGDYYHDLMTQEQKERMQPIREMIFTALSSINESISAYENDLKKRMKDFVGEPKGEKTTLNMSDLSDNVLNFLSNLPLRDNGFHVYKEDETLVAEMRHNDTDISYRLLGYDLLNQSLICDENHAQPLFEMISAENERSELIEKIILELPEASDIEVEHEAFFIPEFGLEQIFHELKDENDNKFQLTGYFDKQIRVSLNDVILGALKWDPERKKFKVNHSFYAPNTPLTVFGMMYNAVFEKKPLSEEFWQNDFSAALAVYEGSEHNNHSLGCCEDQVDTSGW